MNELKQSDIVSNLLMSVFGSDKTGKTRLILQMEPGLAVLNFDRNPGNLYRKAVLSGKKVFLQTYSPVKMTLSEFLLKQDKYRRLATNDPNMFLETVAEIKVNNNKEVLKRYRNQIKLENSALLTQFYNDVNWAIQNDKINSIAIDNASNLWLLICLVYFGRASRIMPMDYGELRSEMNNIIGLLESSGKDVIITSEEKPRYVGGKEVDEYINQGDSKLKYRVKTNLRMYKNDGDYVLKILNSSENPDVSDLEILNEDITIENLRELIYG